jgi:hypothetical protein
MAHVDGELATVRGRKRVLGKGQKGANSSQLLPLCASNASLDIVAFRKIKFIGSPIKILVLTHPALLLSS